MASNDIGSNEHAFTLTMLSLAPNFVDNLEPTKEVCQKEPLILECRVDGSPLPVVQWYKDNEELKSTDR